MKQQHAIATMALLRGDIARESFATWRSAVLRARRERGLLEKIAAKWLHRRANAALASWLEFVAMRRFARATLARHRSSHDALTSHLEARLHQIDRQKLLASRPHLRTADR